MHIEIDKIDRTSWDQLITQFDDATLFQTWGYGALPGRNVSHIVVKSGDETVGCCQASLRQLGFFNIGIAYIKWGPLCMKRGRVFSSDVLLSLVRGIKEEYAIKRGYLIKIWPHAKGERKELLKQILENEGFKRDCSIRPYRTLLLDLSYSLDDLRKNLLRGWRRSLDKAERGGLNIIEGTNIELLGTIGRLAKECEEIKNFEEQTDFEAYRHTQENLPSPLKMRFVVCEDQGEPVCASAYSVIGDTGVYTLTGTGKKAYGLNATHLVQWHMIKQLKGRGAHYFDLGPFNPELNPGVYHFKSGIAGKIGLEEIFLGEFHGYFNLRGRMVRLLLDCLNFLRGISKTPN